MKIIVLASDIAITTSISAIIGKEAVIIDEFSKSDVKSYPLNSFCIETPTLVRELSNNNIKKKKIHEKVIYNTRAYPFIRNNFVRKKHVHTNRGK